MEADSSQGQVTGARVELAGQGRYSAIVIATYGRGQALRGPGGSDRRPAAAEPATNRRGRRRFGRILEVLIAELRPAEFHAFDLFQLHQAKRLWGRPAAEIFGERTHADYYADAVRDSSIVIHEGPSAETLKSLPDGHLDLAYIDAGHDYDSVLQDAQQCVRAVRPSGILVFNDYVLHDPFAGVDYGVVPVVNDLVVNQGWRVVGFALHKHLFCDIAMTRRL